jgi:hypothetical protein
MTARGGGPNPRPNPTELRNMGPRGVPTYPLRIAEWRHRNLPSLTKERNPGEGRRERTCAVRCGRIYPRNLKSNPKRISITEVDVLTK